MFDGKIIRDKLIGNDDERAVSPVIGVILMVAITVILAAVIAAFVMDMGPGEQPPQAQITWDNNADYDSEAELGYLSHEGGDELDLDEIEIHVGEVDDDNYILDANGNFDDEGGDIEVVDFSSGEEYGVGNTTAIEATDSEVGNGEDYEVTVIHSGSDSILFDGEFTSAE